MTIRILLALLVLVFCFQAEAKDKNFMVRGWGAESCGSWTKEQAHRSPVAANGSYTAPRGSNVEQQVQWVDGFISAFNFYQSKTPDVAPDMNGVLVWIDKYCAAHPLDQISTATTGLLAELSKRGAKSE